MRDLIGNMRLKKTDNISVIGIDIGASSLKAIGLIDKKIAWSFQKPHQGNPLIQLKEVAKDFKYKKIGLASKTPFPGFEKIYDPSTCLCQAARNSFPEANHIIEVGANNSVYITLDDNGLILSIQNSPSCAAGTGSFLDVQAKRMGIELKDIEKMKPVLEPPTISTRCAVFAKSDLVYGQQEGYTVNEMWSGLCQGLADNLANFISNSNPPQGLMVLCGGVALNKTFVYWLQKMMKDKVRSPVLQIMPMPEYAVALGAALLASQNQHPDRFVGSTIKPKSQNDKRPVLRITKSKIPNLTHENSHWDEENNEVIHYNSPKDSGRCTSAFLGVDIGSISTKLVMIDPRGNLILSVYRRTEGQPIRATKKLFKAVLSEMAKRNQRINILGAATTGSGRMLIGEIIGADFVINEVSAHVKGTTSLYPEAETIFEIGGQDSKFMSIRNKRMIDINLNYGCAAGTGAFIEELAAKLGYTIEEVGKEVLGTAPPITSSRCTVFMEQDINTLLGNGISRREAAGAVIYSVCENYLERVVGGRHISSNSILFQGATARNRGLIAAFENVLDTEIVVPPNCHVMGALGAALIAIDHKREKSRFRGFGIAEKEIVVEHENCSLCKNHCRLSRVNIEGEKKSQVYGMKCGRDQNQTQKRTIPEYNVYHKVQRLFSQGQSSPIRAITQPIIGIPSSLITYNLSKFWNEFFSSLGLAVKWSPQTNHSHIESGNACKQEICLPVKATCGHALSLLHDKQIDAVFTPHLLTVDPVDGLAHSRFCPYICAFPSLLKAILSSSESNRNRLISPVIDFHLSDEWNAKAIVQSFSPILKLKKSDVIRALVRARKARDAFETQVEELGRSALEKINKSKKPAIIIVGPPYSILDKEINKDIPFYIAVIGLEVIPMPCIPFKPGLLEGEFQNLYWSTGQHIISSLIQIAKARGLYAIYLSSYGCGPDSLLLTYAESIMGGKPFLAIEMDEHGSSGGYQTRVEAFLDVVKSDWQEKKSYIQYWESPREVATSKDYEERTIWIPPMHPVGNRLFAGTFRAQGYKAQTLPPEDSATFSKGKKCTRGTECLPTPLVLGTLLNQLEEEKASGKEPEKNSAFFMPSSLGPCRFGQYRTLDRIILDNLGYDEIPILSPGVHNAYEGLGSRFRDKLWESIIVSDILYKMRCHIRPFEATPGDTEETLERSIEKAEKMIQSGRTNWSDFLQKSMNDFCLIPTKDRVCPLVGVVGEIYLRFNAFGNNGLVEYIEDMGGEVWISPVSEWILHTIWLNRYLNKKREKSLKNTFKQAAKLFYMSNKKHRLFNTIKPMFSQRKEPSAPEIAREGSKLVPLEFEGESIVTLGRALFFKQDGADLIVNCSSFGCMHGNITATIFEQNRQQIGIPVVNTEYDGQENNKTLGTFLREAVRNRERKNEIMEAARNTPYYNFDRLRKEFRT